MTNVHTDFEISSFLWSKFLTFWHPLFFWISRTSVLLLELERLYESYVITDPGGEAPFQVLRPRQGRKKWISFNFHVSNPKFWSFLVSWKNTCSNRDFSQTHRRTPRIHFWIANTLTYRGKLLPWQTFTQILRNLHFCDRNFSLFDTHTFSKFPVFPYYS